MNLVDKYIFKQLFNNSFLILTLIISVFCLGKSVQLVELMVNRGLPIEIFFKLILFSLPQIIPVLLPITICLSIFFVYSRMQTDRELMILRSSCFSPFDLIKPTFYFSLILSFVSFFFTLHQAPKSNENFKILLYTIKNDYSSTLLQEGTFNTIGKSFTIFLKQRDSDGVLNSIFIHDTRDPQKPSTLIANKGRLINTKEATKILLEQGSQQFQSKEKKLSILYFDQYLLNVNQEKDDSFINRWKSPSERTLSELKNPDPSSGDDLNNLQSFKAEITLRYSMPLNILAFGFFIISYFLSFSYHRVEDISQTIKIMFLIIFLQILSIMSSNLSIKLINMHYINFFPFFFCLISSIYFIRKTQKIKDG